MRRFVSAPAFLAVCPPSYSYEKLSDRYSQKNDIRTPFESCAPSDLNKSAIYAAAGSRRDSCGTLIDIDVLKWYYIETRSNRPDRIRVNAGNAGTTH
jgi:hypothetical protein